MSASQMCPSLSAETRAPNRLYHRANFFLNIIIFYYLPDLILNLTGFSFNQGSHFELNWHSCFGARTKPVAYIWCEKKTNTF